MQQLVSQYGQETLELDSAVPTYSLRRHFGSVHVSKTDEQITRMIKTRITKIKKLVPDEADKWTDEIVSQTIQAALWFHHENQLEYRAVMSGRC